MSMTTLRPFPCPVNRGGRPKVSDIPDERQRHVAATAILEADLIPAKQLARLLGVSRRTLGLWKKSVLTSGSPEAERIRLIRLAVGRQAREQQVG